jgi:hypothetical protein
MTGAYGQLTSEQWKMVLQVAKDAGINAEPYWEAVPYTGHPKVFCKALCIEKGWFSKPLIVSHDDLERIRWLINCIGHKRWALSFETGQWQLGHGDFVILQKHTFRGGDGRPVIELLLSFGADQELVDHTLNYHKEEVQGYVLSSTFKEASALAQTIEQGAAIFPTIERTVWKTKNQLYFSEFVHLP